MGRPPPGARQDPDQGIGAEEFANDAAAEVTGGSGDEDGGGSDDGLFSVELAVRAPAGAWVGAFRLPDYSTVSRSHAADVPIDPSLTPCEPGAHAEIVLGDVKRADLAPIPDATADNVAETGFLGNVQPDAQDAFLPVTGPVVAVGARVRRQRRP